MILLIKIDKITQQKMKNERNKIQRANCDRQVKKKK